METALDDIKAMTIAELAGLSSHELLLLQRAAESAWYQAQSTREWVAGAIALKYGERTQSLRQDLGKDTGVVHFEDDGVTVTNHLPKKPQWDQAKLAAISKRMMSQGDDPSEWMDISYKVPERRYSAWPDSLKADFESARILGVGKATFKLSAEEEGER